MRKLLSGSHEHPTKKNQTAKNFDRDDLSYRFLLPYQIEQELFKQGRKGLFVGMNLTVWRCYRH